MQYLVFFEELKHSVEVVAVPLKSVLHVRQRLENLRMLWPETSTEVVSFHCSDPVWKLSSLHINFVETQEKRLIFRVVVKNSCIRKKDLISMFSEEIEG